MTDGELLRITDIVRETRLSRATIQRAIKAEELKVFRFGRAVRIHPADLEAWQRSKRTGERKAA